MDSAPLFVSVVIPVLNEGRSLETVVEALLAQDYPTDLFEILIVDGGSTDETPSLAARFSRAHPNVRVLPNAARLSSAGRNAGARAAKGDAVMFVDVLHHTDDPNVLLREARRVARQCVVIKDHRRDGVMAGTTLRVMDWVGNAHHGVRLPYNYWSEREWRHAFSSTGLKPEVWKQRLGIHGPLLDTIVGRGLHFITRLIPA